VPTTIKAAVDEALDLAESDPDTFVAKAKETGRAVGEALEKLNEVYLKSQVPGAAKKFARDAAIRTVAREIKRRRGSL
jgi:hypothetical protein